MTGVLAARRLDRLVAFAVIGSMGMVMIAISLFTPQSIGAALYYIVHSTLAAAALFLITDLVLTGRGKLDLRSEMPMAGANVTAALFFVGAIAMAGLPPLSGFLGKLMILTAAYDSALMIWIWAVVLITSLISVVGFSRAGSTLFWKARALAPAPPAEGEAPPPPTETGGQQPSLLSYAAAGGLLTLLALHTVFAGPIARHMSATAEQLFAPAPYVEKVLGTPGKLSTPKEGH
jgi:multicomponent K+:H+ antiporter subunit D